MAPREQAADGGLVELRKNCGELGKKVRAVWAVQRVPGSFAALRMTARTNNGNGNGNGEKATAKAKYRDLSAALLTMKP
jgi:hypothetical protein